MWPGQTTLLPAPATIALCCRWLIHLRRPVLGKIITPISGTNQISPHGRRRVPFWGERRACKKLPYWSDNFRGCALIGSKDNVIDLIQIPLEGAIRQRYIENSCCPSPRPPKQMGTPRGLCRPKPESRDCKRWICSEQKRHFGTPHTKV